MLYNPSVKKRDDQDLRVSYAAAVYGKEEIDAVNTTVNGSDLQEVDKDLQSL